MRHLPKAPWPARIQGPNGQSSGATRQWEIVHMDAVGPLQMSEKGNKYVVTFVDSISKYAEAIPIPDISAGTCARVRMPPKLLLDMV
jgi:hypothetical protein